MSLLLISFLVGIAIFALITLSKGLFGSNNLISERIFSLALGIIFVIRFLLFKSFDVIESIPSGDKGIILGNGGLIYANLLMWFEITAILILVLRPFFKFKTVIWYAKYISLGVFTVFFISLPFIAHHLELISSFGLASYFAVEIGYGFAISIYYHLNDRKIKIEKTSYSEVTLVSLFINLITIPVALPSFLFSQSVTINNDPLYSSFLVYVILLFIPLLLFGLLKNSEKDKIKFYLIFICLGACINFIELGTWKDLFSPWNWPLNLVELGLILLTLAVLFNLKKVFNFVLIIILFSTFLSILLPTYDLNALVISKEVISYYATHFVVVWICFACLLLKVFKAPKLKEIIYSTIGFTCYYLLTLILNITFKGLSGTTFELFHETFVIKSPNYFFSDSAYLIYRIGLPWTKIYSISVPFSINGKEFALHPVFELIHYWLFIFFEFSFYYLAKIAFEAWDSLRLNNQRLEDIN